MPSAIASGEPEQQPGKTLAARYLSRKHNSRAKDGQISSLLNTYLRRICRVKNRLKMLIYYW
jgi:hypothetical protein